VDPDALITGAHRAVSATMIAASSSGVVPVGSTPSARSLALISGVRVALMSIAFLLIADIDSPRGGLIHVFPQSLQSLSGAIPAK
jgi:hypothetical protein